ncbi:MAG TPA: hypothetical protein VLV78_03775 [Thermoanaerobaculia bacterium]|nr:hypothetical protein [Thermoanaerobaculia bacterium]
MFISLVVLLASAVVATAQLTPEQPVSTPRYGPAPGDQFAPVVATNGSEFLVAWFDGRGIPGAIYANRVTRDGRILDGTGIRIPPDTYSVGPRLLGAFFIDGAYALLYASSERVGMARISENGELIEAPRTIFEGQFVRAAAANRSRIVLVAETEIDALNSRGELVERTPMPSAYGVSIGTNGTSFLVGTFTFDGTNSVYLIALDANGKQTDITRVGASASGDGPIIGSDGKDYLVIYDDARRGAPIALAVSPHVEIRSSTISGYYSALVWTGDAYLATTTTTPTQQIAMASLDRTGTVIQPAQVLGSGTPGTVNQPAAAWDGNEALIAWTIGSQPDPYGYEVVGAIARRVGDATPFRIPSSSNMQERPVIATSRSQDLVAWAEPDGIYASRITAEGVPLDGGGIQITQEGQTLRAIYDGAAYIVAWGGYDGVKAQRIDPNTGSLVGPAVDLAGCSRSFDLVMGADSPVLFVVPCSDNRVFAQRMGVSGVVGAGVPVSPADIFADQPRAAWNGSQWLVAWIKLIPLPLLISPPAYRGNVYATRMSAALTVVDVQPLPIAVSDFFESSPLVATSGNEFAIAWSHDSFNEQTGVYLRRVQGDGSVSEPSVVTRGRSAATSFIGDGRRYALTYTRNGDLFLTHLAGDEVPISATATDERYASLVAPAGRPPRIVYTRVATEPEYGGVSRVFMRDEIGPRRRSVRSR